MIPLQQEPASAGLLSSVPLEEVRGLYIATVYNIDYPSRCDLSAEALRAELDRILDDTEAAGLNTVYFQVRPACDALYDSEIFPVSSVLSSTGELTMDPLAYLLEEAHKRTIAVHAWINPFRVTVGSASYPNISLETLPEDSPARLHPEWVVAYADGRLYLDPGIPEVRTLIADGVREIVRNYPVDGVLFDDYFYPYPVQNSDGTTAVFADQTSFSQYGGTMELADWRRENINCMIEETYSAIQEENADVKFGVAPFGIWQNDDGQNDGSSTRGMESYHSIYCDPLAWAQGGYIDYLAPQIYWRFSTQVAPFDEIASWWNRQLDGTSVELLISHAASYYDTWDEPQGEMHSQIAYARQLLSYRGSIFYGYGTIRRNAFSIRDELCQTYTERLVYLSASPTGLSVEVHPPTEVSSYDAFVVLLRRTSRCIAMGRQCPACAAVCLKSGLHCTRAEICFPFSRMGRHMHIRYTSADNFCVKMG